MSDRNGNILVVHLMGRRPETCPEYTKRNSCSQCSYAMSRIDPPKWTENIEGIVDYEVAKELIGDHSTCVRSLLWTLVARANIIVMPKGISINEYTRQMLPQDNHLHLDDEGDTFADIMFNETFSSFQVARSRTNKRHFNLTGCTGKCSNCVLDYASSVQGSSVDCDKNVRTLDQGMNDPVKFIEFLRDCVEDIEQQISARIIKPSFNLEAVRRNIDVLSKILHGPEHYIHKNEKQISPSEHLRRERLALLGESWSTDPKKNQDKLHELENEVWNNDKQPFPSVKFEPTITDETIFNWESDDLPHTDDSENDYLLNSLLLKNIFVDPKNYKSWNGLSWEDKVLLLAFADFALFAHRVGQSKDQQALLCHLPRSGNHQPHCEIKLIALDVSRFRTIIQRITTKKTILLSGTFLNGRMAAASILVPEEQIEFIDNSIPLHNQVIIINHNHRLGTDLPTSQRFGSAAFPKAFDHRDLCVLLATIFNQRHNLQTSILIFLPTKEQAKQFSQFAKSFPELRGVGIYHVASSNEVRTSPNNILILGADEIPISSVVTNHYRSAHSRGTNLEQFDVCIGFGGGLPNFFSFHALQKAITEETSTPVTLEEIVNYNRIRVVSQALMRIPRDGNKFRVLLYFGDMQPWDVPSFMRNRLINAAIFYQDLEPAGENPFSTRTKNILARSQAGRLGDVVCELLLHGQKTLESYLPETPSPAQDTPRTIINHSNYTAERWQHVQDFVTTKGWLHRRDDGTAGAIEGWLAFLEHLIAMGVLKEQKVGQKKVLVPGPAYPTAPEVVRE